MGIFGPISALSSIATTLIFFERDASFYTARPQLKFRVDKTLRFWIDCSYENKRHENARRSRTELIAEILREFEASGDAMRHLDARGRVAWKASPAMLRKLADAEREVLDDMEDRP